MQAVVLIVPLVNILQLRHHRAPIALLEDILLEQVM